MGCIIIALALFLPRVTLFGFWLFTDCLTRAFSGAVFWPLMGFIFAPYTTIAWGYGNMNGGFHGFNLALIILAALLDLGCLRGGSREAQKRKDGSPQRHRGREKTAETA